MIAAFTALPADGPSRSVRQIVAFPMVALLSRERRATGGDAGSIRWLALLQVFGAGCLSWMIQGIGAAVVLSALFAVGALWAFRD
ncbi:hypothetical protein [Symbioplanes lichenis]|uniref:hypothetical protein n=1 Tax=Symbioplanes lichenis TaxID=1629072 RepID=UPI002739F07C|nr:hypothetical protein [Actinoplanes lichenis]